MAIAAAYRTCRVLVLMTLAFSGASRLRAASPTVEEVIAAYERAAAGAKNVTFEAVSDTTFKGVKVPDWALIERRQLRHVHRGSRWKLTYRHEGYTDFRVLDAILNQDSGTFVTEAEFVSSGDQIVCAMRESDTEGSEPFTYVTAYDDHADAFQWLAVHLDAAGFLFGHVVGIGQQAALWDVLRTSKSRLRTDEQLVVGHPMFVVEADAEDGQYTVWCDPSADYWPRRVRSRRRGDGKERIGGDGSVLSGKVLAEAIVEVRDVDLLNVKGQWFPSRFVAETTYAYTDDSRDVARTEFAASGFEVAVPSSSETFQVTLDVPNGTPVSMDRQPQMLYVWHDGKYVKTYDDPSGLDELTLGDRRRPWGIIISLHLLAAAVIGVWLYLRR